MANLNGITPVVKVWGGPVDFAIVTALKLEREAVLKRLDERYQTLQEDNEPLTYYYGHVTIPTSGERYTVIAVMLLGMGSGGDNACNSALAARACANGWYRWRCAR